MNFLAKIRAGFLGLLFAVALAPAWATPALVQITKSADTNDGTAATVATAAFASASTAGNTIVGHVTWQQTLGALTSVTDGTNTYSIVDSTVVSVGDNINMATFVAQNIAGGGTLTITANFTNTPAFRRITASEISGVLTTGQPNAHKINASATFGTGTDAVTSTSATTTADGCYIYGAAYDESANTIPSAGTSFTSRDTATFTAGDAWRVEDRVQSSQGSIAATFTITGGTQSLGVAMVALAPSAGAAATASRKTLTGAGK